MIFTGSMLQVVLSWSVVAFSVATVVLAIDKVKLSSDLNEAKHKLDYLESQLVGDVQPRSMYQGADNSPTTEVEMDYRLPDAIYPTHYDLYLHPNIDNGSFSGRVNIEVKVVEVTEQIILHAHKLDIENVVVAAITGNYLLESSFQLDEMREFLIINMQQKLWLTDNDKITIEFRGLMHNKIVGLYSSYYQTASGERKGIATSKFEPTYARQAFPCFDEPAMKATFTVTLVHPNGDGYHALSNMNEEEKTILANMTEIRFAKSVPMSTYLACFIVSDFAHTSKTVRATGFDKNFDIRIFATAHQLSKTSFALDSAVAVTEFYINYFQLGYPLPKLDMAAIPDFVSNAMEHWGLVTYRETALLYDPTVSSTWNKQRIGAVVAHELAHMWFGNLVTMMWWNDLWLNEGFARYMEYKGNHEVYPEWGLPDQFLIHALHSVLKYDASVASHPIIQTVTSPDQITEMFDTISYEKGASIIRMLEDFVGEEIFRVAVGNYLSNFKFKNAISNDFFGEVAKMGFDFDVIAIMRTWTTQMGLPVVNVSRISNTEYRLTQKRFLANIEDYDVFYNDSEFNYTWDIPITYQTDLNSSIQRLWLQYDDSFKTINVPSDTKWIKLNAKQVGYYRINYAPENWRALIATLLQSPQTFSIADRAHLLNDVFALADASQLSYDIALDMTKYLAKELDFVPWYVATAKFEALQTSLRYTDCFVDYLSYSRELIKKAYHDVSWIVHENDHLRNRLRVSILSTACSLGLPECIQEASNRFRKWLAAPTEKPHPDLREIIYYYGMQHVGRESSWKKMWQIYMDEQDASEKTKLMYGLSGVREPWLLHRFVELAADEQHVRRQDYFNCLQYIAANPAGEAVVWDYVRDHWQDLVDRFGLNERFLGRMIPTITERFSSLTKLEEMTKFFAKHPEAGAGTAARKQALETVKYNIKWLAENKEKVANWLKNNSAN